MIRGALASVVLVAALCGCQQSTPEAAASKEPSSSSLLDGPIPECKVLRSPAGEPYMKAAKEECSKARTFNERMNNVGCQVQDRYTRC